MLDLYPFRMCSFCKRGDFVSRDGRYQLVSYSTRRYAHWHCLVERKGLSFATANVPEHQQRSAIRGQLPGYNGEGVPRLTENKTKP
jgi:hypothetical protein